VNRRIGVCLLSTCLVAACTTTTSFGSRATHLLVGTPTTVATTAKQSPATTTTLPPSEADCLQRHLETASLRPTGPLPAPGHMLTGSWMAHIVKRGYLIAGVDQTTLGFGYREPTTGTIQGFDIDMVDEVAKAIFASAEGHVVLLPVTSSQREAAIYSGRVDIVASLMSMTCDRWTRELFSTEYYQGYQAVLVRTDSPIHSLRDLVGKRVCATHNSTSLQQFPKGWVRYAVDTRPECLAALQDGTVDAISTDDNILWGFELQDPNTRIVTLPRADAIHVEPYGLAVAKSHPELVRFMNAVLEQMRLDGRWEQLYSVLRRTLDGAFVPPRVHVPPEQPPSPVYQEG
jgi:polar amino acid transport system substrate-binding protein